MKRALLCGVLLVWGAGLVLLQTTPPATKLAAWMPSGALIYLESPDFGRLMRDWDSSKVKADWLNSDNYAAFSRSNLFTKLAEVYGQYGEAAGFAPGLKSVMEIAGTDSALALYEIREAEFLYITRIGDAELAKAQLWAVRDKFERREAGGVSFYLRTDPASKRTVAFVFAKGYLLLATRDDLMAQALELLGGGSKPSIASDRWYSESTAAAGGRGKLRMALNVESLVKSVYFRSYWIQRNASMVRRYWAETADVKLAPGSITETRVLLRAPDPASAGVEPAGDAVSSLLEWVPPEAGVYKVSRACEPADAAGLIVEKLIGPQRQRVGDWRRAPMPVPADDRAGSEGDLETRIDEQPLPPDEGRADATGAVRELVEKTGCRAWMSVQQSSTAGPFVEMPAVIAVNGEHEWDGNAVSAALGTAAGKLWSTSQLGARWVAGTEGQHPVKRLNGLGVLIFAASGRLLFISNDVRFLTAVLDRRGAKAPSATLVYAAGFRHLREHINYERVMRALEPEPHGLFSDNIGSLSRVLASVREVRVAQEEQGGRTYETVTYEMRP